MIGTFSSNPLILVVDDDAANLEVLALVLKATYAVRVAQTGKLALQIAAAEPQPDLILLDISMEGMDGYAVLEQLKASARTRHIPVIFVTAMDTPEDEYQGFDRGAVDYIHKPIHPSVVLARVHLHLSLQQAQRKLAEQNVQLEANLAMKSAELEHSQRQIMQAEKMAAIGLLAGGIAHDFNNLLFPIIGYTEMALEEMAPEDPLHQDLRQVYKAGIRARDLVAQILLFSRKAEYEKKPVRVSLIVKEVLHLLRVSLPATIEIESSIAPEAGDGSVLGEPSKVHQILMNICTNAAHAMQEGGVLRVTLTTDWIDPAMAVQHHIAPGPCLRLSMADTGHGIAPEIQEKIFEPYFTTKEPGEGTGLGLSVVYGIVKSLRGCILVESQPHRGTAFHVYLPQFSDSSPPEVAEKTELPRLAGTALLVNDEQTLLQLEATMLQRLGITVVACSSASEALAHFRAAPQRFDLVVTDQTMPKMTGLQLAEQLLKCNPNQPIILCSGFNVRATRETVRAAGICELLIRPFSVYQLGRAIASCISPWLGYGEEADENVRIEYSP